MSLDKRRLVLRWRNSERVRRNMLSQEIISEAAHFSFIDGLSGRRDKMYFLFSIDSVPFGVLDFVNCNWNKKTTETGLYIGEDRFLGLGFLLYYYNFQVAFEHFPFETINTSILKNNKGAFSICSRLFGLRVNGETETEWLVAYTKNDWSYVSSSLKEKILSNANIEKTEWI